MPRFSGDEEFIQRFLENEVDTTIFIEPDQEYRRNPRSRPEHTFADLRVPSEPVEPTERAYLRLTAVACLLVAALVVVFVVPGWFGPGPTRPPGVPSPPPPSPYVDAPPDRGAPPVSVGVQ